MQVHMPAAGWARRVTEVRRKLDVFHDYPAARLSDSHHSLQGFLWLCDMREQKPSIHEVVGLDFSKVGDVLGSEYDWQLVPGCLATGQLQTALVPVDAHGFPGGADSKSESKCDRSDATADIQAVHPAADADSSKKRFGRWP